VSDIATVVKPITEVVQVVMGSNITQVVVPVGQVAEVVEPNVGPQGALGAVGANIQRLVGSESQTLSGNIVLGSGNAYHQFVSSSSPGRTITVTDTFEINNDGSNVFAVTDGVSTVQVAPGMTCKVGRLPNSTFRIRIS
jgi:hypothetical protein